MHTILNKKIVMLRSEDIKASLTPPRQDFDVYDMKKLADSISVNGIIVPLLVKKSFDGRYEIISGERRFRAARMVGLRRIPCIIHTLDEKNAAIFAVVDNLARKNLNFFEEAAAFKKIVKYYGLSQSEAAMKLGISPAALANKIRLLNISRELQNKIISANLTEQHARCILRLTENKQTQAIDYIIENSLNVTETEEYIEGILNPPTEISKQEKPIRKYAIGDVRLFYNSLSKLVDVLQSSGVDAKTRKVENDKYIEYKVRINKEQIESNKSKQLKIC